MKPQPITVKDYLLWARAHQVRIPKSIAGFIGIALERGNRKEAEIYARKQTTKIK